MALSRGFGSFGLIDGGLRVFGQFVEQPAHALWCRRTIHVLSKRANIRPSSPISNVTTNVWRNFVRLQYLGQLIIVEVQLNQCIEINM